jgi:hypothetical protein
MHFFMKKFSDCFQINYFDILFFHQKKSPFRRALIGTSQYARTLWAYAIRPYNCYLFEIPQSLRSFGMTVLRVVL